MEIEDRIKHTTLNLFMQYGLKSVSMDDIARELGISKKTLYKYFENKEALIHNIVLDYIEHEQAALTQIKEVSRDAVDEMLNIAKHVTRMFRNINPRLVFDLQKYYPKSWKAVQELQSKFVFTTIMENILKGVSEGFYRDDFCPNIIAKLYVGKTFFLVDEKHFPLRKYERRQLVIENIRYHLRGIVNENGYRLLGKYMSEEEE